MLDPGSEGMLIVESFITHVTFHHVLDIDIRNQARNGCVTMGTTLTHHSKEEDWSHRYERSSLSLEALSPISWPSFTISLCVFAVNACSIVREKFIHASILHDVFITCLHDDFIPNVFGKLFKFSFQKTLEKHWKNFGKTLEKFWKKW